MVTGGAGGDFAGTVANEGNVPLAVTLSGDDPENRVDFAFEPRQLRLPPGTAAQARLLVHADRPLTGAEVRRTLTVHAHADGLTVDKTLAFVQTPQIGSGWLKAAKLAGAAAGGPTPHAGRGQDSRGVRAGAYMRPEVRNPPTCCTR